MHFSALGRTLFERLWISSPGLMFTYWLKLCLISRPNAHAGNCIRFSTSGSVSLCVRLPFLLRACAKKASEKEVYKLIIRGGVSNIRKEPGRSKSLLHWLQAPAHILTIVSFLHHSQKRGKFSNFVFALIFVFVFFPHSGQRIYPFLSFFIFMLL